MKVQQLIGRIPYYIPIPIASGRERATSKATYADVEQKDER